MSGQLALIDMAEFQKMMASLPDKFQKMLEESEEFQRMARFVRASRIVDDELNRRCWDLLAEEREGMYDTAAREACVLLEDRLRKIINAPFELYGVRLVDEALHPERGKLVFSEVPAEQESVHLLYRGVMGFFKNPLSHRMISYSPTRARQVVALVDLLLGLLSEARLRGGPNKA